MGTRHLTIAQLDGKYKVAQYGQWDGYPAGQGVTVYEFLSSRLYGPLELFKEKVRATKPIEAGKIEQYYKECGSDGSGWVPIDVAKAFGQKHPELSRDTGAEILELIFNAPPGVELKNDIEFAASSLFCEWAYVLDFDKNVLEVYKGFVTDPESLKEGRFKDMEYEKEKPGENQYYPITLLCSFPFDSLPATAEEFVKFCEDRERARDWAEWDREEKLTWLKEQRATRVISEPWDKLSAELRTAFAEDR